MMDDKTLLALCIYSEAAGEPNDGKEAVAQVILNRMRLHYQSDGTVQGTVLHPSAFSGFWFEMIGGKYTRVAFTLADAQARAADMLGHAQRQSVWPECLAIAGEALAAPCVLAAPQGLERAVLYLNPAIIPRLPAWATPAAQCCVVGHHTFYKDPGVHP